MQQILAKTLRRLIGRTRREPRPVADPSSEIRAFVDLKQEAVRIKLRALSFDQVADAFSDDRWLQNYYLNLWEQEHHAIVLKSYPVGVSLPIADICNARCTFCSSWLEGSHIMKPSDLKRYREVLPYARLLGIQGHGEPLANPHIHEILSEVADLIDPRAVGYIITNGVFLGKHLESLYASRIVIFNVSLNAVTPETHDVVMGLGCDVLPEIIDTIKRAVALREHNKRVEVTISMVLTAANIHEAARFVELGNMLNVTRIYLRTLMPISDATNPIAAALNYHRQSPVLNPDFSSFAADLASAVKQSKVDIETSPDTWSADALTPSERQRIVDAPPAYISRHQAANMQEFRRDLRATKLTYKNNNGTFHGDVFDLVENPYNRSAPFDCRFVYSQLITTKLNFELYPCCYMTHVPGHEHVIFSDDAPFMTHWNSPAMVNLRRRLRDGPLFQACATCPSQQ